MKRGQIVFPGGTSYRLLALPEVETMTPRLVRKVKELVQAGATVFGLPPRKSPSLVNYPQCDAEVRRLAGELWSDGVVEWWSDGKKQTPPRDSTLQLSNTPFPHRRVGKGRVFLNRQPHRSPTASASESEPLDGAKWIWFDEGDPAAAAPVARRYFRRSFVLPDGASVESATASLTADNTFELFVNGKRIGTGDNFHEVSEFQIGTQLKPGTNVLAVVVDNGGDAPNPAGLIASVQLRLRGGEKLVVRTDREWRAAASVSGRWQANALAGEDWSAARELGEAGMSPWGKIGKSVADQEIYPDYANLTAVLRDAGVPPDFEADAPLRYTHRRDGDAEIYFVANPSAEEVTTTATFRVSGRRPELWSPETGRIVTAGVWEQKDGRTRLPLKFDPHGSMFVIFRQHAKALPTKSGRNWDEFTPAQSLTGPWEVSFQSGRGAPEKLTFEALTDWSKHPDSGVKFFSGLATYRKTFDWKPQQSAIGNRQSAIFLNLGSVAVMARVRLNGQDLGVVWNAPFRVAVGDALKPGENHLEITVANLWPNRLIGDAALPKEERIAKTTWNPFKPDAELLESGLLGSVSLQVLKN